jgi:hypothetical protein
MLPLQIQRLLDEKTSELKSKKARAELYKTLIQQLREEVLQLKLALLTEYGATAGVEITKKFMEDVEALKKEYFFTLALGVKLNRAIQQKPTNIDVAEMWKAAQPIPWQQWNNWVLAEIDKKH